MVQSSRNGGIGIKRRYPLMLNDASHRPSKIFQLSEELSNLNSSPVSVFQQLALRLLSWLEGVENSLTRNLICLWASEMQLCIAQ
jgi:hypothetical protein